MSKGYLTIGQVSKLVRRTPATVRRWHMQGRLIPSKTTETGVRLYEEIKVSKLVAILKRDEVKRGKFKAWVK
jgi:DNA-binding transcriptional MerR regulator